MNTRKLKEQTARKRGRIRESLKMMKPGQRLKVPHRDIVEAFPPPRYPDDGPSPKDQVINMAKDHGADVHFDLLTCEAVFERRPNDG